MNRDSRAYFFDISLLLLMFFSAGCNSVTTEEHESEGMAAPESLGGPWFIEYIEDRPVIDRSPANIEFGEDGQVSGSSSCNRFTGSYETTGNALKIGPLATTRRACIDALGEQEQRFLASIAKVSQWTMENGLLILSDEAGRELFRAAKHNPTRITGIATYRQRIAMPEGAVFEAVLEDVSKMDVAAPIIASVEIENPGNVPIQFSIDFSPADIDAKMSYSVRAAIRVDGELWATTDTAYPVLTRGSGSSVDVRLQLAK